MFKELVFNTFVKNRPGLSLDDACNSEWIVGKRGQYHHLKVDPLKITKSNVICNYHRKITIFLNLTCFHAFLIYFLDFLFIIISFRSRIFGFCRIFSIRHGMWAGFSASLTSGRTLYCMSEKSWPNLYGRGNTSWTQVHK